MTIFTLADKEITTTHVKFIKLFSPERKASKEDKDEGQQHQSSTTVQLHLRWQGFKHLHCRNLNTTLTSVSTVNPTHTHTRLFLWIVGTFHRLLLLLYWPNDIFYPLTQPVCTATLSDTHHLLFFYNFFPSGDLRPFPTVSKKLRYYYPCGDIRSSQCSISTHTQMHIHTNHI